MGLALPTLLEVVHGAFLKYSYNRFSKNEPAENPACNLLYCPCIWNHRNPPLTLWWAEYPF